MGSLVRLLLPLLLGVIAVEARLPRIFWGMDNGRPARDRMFQRIIDAQTTTPPPCTNYSESWWTQPKDHFDANNKDTWKQYYQTNDKFFDWKKTDRPIIFLNIGGEGPISAQWVCWENYTYTELAQQYGALIIQLEHRFFEPNAKTSLWPDMKTSTLKLLTTEQAMADAANFIDGFNKQYKFTNAVWVGFGGSYPGTLAGLLRVFYPNATAGNIASSAPLYPKVDFFEYAQVMVNTIRSTDQTCYNNVLDAFGKVFNMTKDAAGQQTLQKTFKTTKGDWNNVLDVQNFMANIFSSLQGVIQYTYDARNKRTRTDLTIKYVCDTFLNKNDPPEVKLYNVFNFDGAAEGGSGWDGTMGDFSYLGGVAPLQSWDISSENAASRGWMWLSCNEFGWLQSTDLDKDNIFGNIIPLSYYLQMCFDLFNDGTAPFNEGDIYSRVEASHQKFGDPTTYSATNVVLPNGAYDPWHALGVNRTIDSQRQTALLTPGAAHCSDMYPKYEGEPAGLEATRTKIREEVCYFILNAGGPVPKGAPCYGKTPNSSGTTPTPVGTTPSKGAAGLGLSTALFVLAAALLKF